MRSLSSCFVIPLLASILFVPVAAAHTGGALDADGCHTDHRTGGYHCHRGAAAGYAFADKAAMQEAVRTGRFPEDSTVDKEGFFSKLWPFGDKYEQQEGSGSDDGKNATPAVSAASGPLTEYEQKLKILQGLFEMGLISREEYEQKRKAVLDGL
jgi:hypothetical protein